MLRGEDMYQSWLSMFGDPGRTSPPAAATKYFRAPFFDSMMIVLPSVQTLP